MVKINRAALALFAAAAAVGSTTDTNSAAEKTTKNLRANERQLDSSGCVTALTAFLRLGRNDPTAEIIEACANNEFEVGECRDFGVFSIGGVTFNCGCATNCNGFTVKPGDGPKFCSAMPLGTCFDLPTGEEQHCCCEEMDSDACVDDILIPVSF